jgi:hypothetical protein
MARIVRSELQMNIGGGGAFNEYIKQDCTKKNRSYDSDKNENNVLRDAVHRLNQGILYFQKGRVSQYTNKLNT